MINFCIESGSQGEAIIHKQSCGSYDNASLLSEGRVCNLGAFDNSFPALSAARNHFPDATRCWDCCRADLMTGFNAAPSASMPAAQLLPV